MKTLLTKTSLRFVFNIGIDTVIAIFGTAILIPATAAFRAILGVVWNAWVTNIFFAGVFGALAAYAGPRL